MDEAAGSLRPPIPAFARIPHAPPSCFEREYLLATAMKQRPPDVPARCAIGMTGLVELGASPVQTSAIDIRGQQDHCTSPGGWEVHVLGQAACARAVAAVLDHRLGTAGQSLSHDDARTIAWSMLPSAAIVAVHQALRRVCLLRDGGGFRPIYYTFRDNTLCFSTNLPHLRSLTTERGINTDKIVEMLVFGHRSGGRTIWQGLNIVGTGCLIEFHADERPRHHQIWQPSVLLEQPERERLAHRSTTEVLEEIGGILEEALTPLRTLDSLVVPCGGGVDSSVLGAWLARDSGGVHPPPQRRVRFFTVNKVDNRHQESEWMDPLAARLRIPVEYVNVTRESFFHSYFEFLATSQQPAIGPNLISHRILRQKALEQGESQFVTGELCDTVFGGLSSFSYLSRRFRLLRLLSRGPRRLRFWLARAISGDDALLLEIMQVARGEDFGRIAGGDLERADLVAEISAIGSGDAGPQRMADRITWLNLRLAPNYLHTAFFEYDEQPGGVTHFPFAHPRMVRLGLHLPHHLKRRRGSNKWIWRRFAEAYLGHRVAFRHKDTFPAPIHLWFDKAATLLANGFLEDLLCARVGDLVPGMAPHDPARWTLVNLELWGRINCWHEDPSALLARVM